MDKWPGWNEINTALALKLWTEGQSAQSVAKQIGAPSRNAVIGRMHRIGHKLAKEDAAVRRGCKGRYKPPRQNAAPKVKPMTAKPREEPARTLELPPEPTRAPATLMQAHPFGCRWPITEEPYGYMDEILFCNDRRFRGSYCEKHFRQATDKPRKAA